MMTHGTKINVTTAVHFGNFPCCFLVEKKEKRPARWAATRPAGRAAQPARLIPTHRLSTGGEAEQEVAQASSRAAWGAAVLNSSRFPRN
jgi:hypothetical protein